MTVPALPTGTPVSSHARALAATGQPQPARLHSRQIQPYVGIIGVLFGCILATLGSRIGSFGLADLRGGLHAGFDEGAWITTSFGVGQMMVGVACPFLGAAFGARRVLLAGTAAFFAASLATPFSPSLPVFLALQAVAGLGSGTFIPLTISFLIRSLPKQLVLYGVAFYAMNSELSQNIAASLEGWYVDHLSWHWLYWQYCVALPVMFAAIWAGVPRERLNLELLRRLDWCGMGYAAFGFALLYAGLDQGNRLDWTGSGLVNGLLAGGSVLTVAFTVRELMSARPFLNMRLLLHGNLPLLLLALALFRFIILSTGYIIPAYLQSVQNFRELQVGAVLLWIALPQLLLALPLAAVLEHADGRWVLAAGTGLIGAACLMAAQLTSVWATEDFLPSQVLQAIGQSCALTALMVLIVQSIVPVEALSIGCMLQISRLFGGEIGTAFMQTLVRVREQLHSYLIGLHVDEGAIMTQARLAGYMGRLGPAGASPSLAAKQASRMLANAIAVQANVLAYADGFAAAAAGAFGCLLLVVIVRRNPAPPR